MRKLYSVALDCGVTPEQFEQYSLAEIEDLINSHVRQEKKERKLAVDQIFVLADAILSRFVSMIDEDSKPLLPWDMYPELFSEERQIYMDQRAEDEFEKFKEKRRRFAAEYNRKYS